MTPCSRREFTAALGAFGLASFSGNLTAAPAGRFRVAVIGHTGRGDYGHGLNTMWLSVPETEIVAVADPVASGLDATMKKLGVKLGFADYRRMLAQTQPDIVSIGMRHVDQHRDVAVAATESGARGIYFEKPFCRTPAEADEIVAACERRKVKLAVAHRNRYHPVLPVIARLLKDGAIGQLLELRARGKEDARGGALDLWVLGSHLLNLIHYFGGAPLACSAAVLQDGRAVTLADVKEGAEGTGPLAGNQVHARFEMERGVPAFFDSVQNAGNTAAGFGVQLVGTKGIIDLRADEEPLAHLLAGSPFQPGKESRAWVLISSAGIGKPEPITDLGKQLSGHFISGRDLIAAIREDRPPLCSAQDGRVTVEMITAVFESHRLGGQRVTWPLAQRSHPLKTQAKAQE